MLDIAIAEHDLWLEELITLQPSSVLKLTVAWDALSIETQIKIFFILKHKIPLQIRKKALVSSSDYIRYLAVKFSKFDTNDNDDRELIAAIEGDSNVLVKNAAETNYDSSFEWLEINDGKNFFLLSQVGRILRLSSSEITAEYFVRIMNWAIENNFKNKEELEELTNEFVGNKSIYKDFQRKPVELDWYVTKRTLDALWQIVVTHGQSVISATLARHLPTQINGKDGVDSKILDLVDPTILAWVLCRNDVFLSDFRKKIIFSEHPDENLFYAAASGYVGVLDLCNMDKSERQSYVKERILNLKSDFIPNVDRFLQEYPEELFSKDRERGKFLEEKIDHIYSELTKLKENIEFVEDKAKSISILFVMGTVFWTIYWVISKFFYFVFK